MDNRRLAFATEIFLLEMRQQAVRSGKSSESIKRLTDYPEDQRSALMAAVRRAIDSTAPKRDEDFANWLARNSQ